MGPLLSVLSVAAPPLINWIESLFKEKPKSGEDKMSALLQAVRAILNQAIAAKVTVDGKPIPPTTDDSLRGMLETIFQQMKTSGQLTSSPPTGNLFLVRIVGVPTRIL